MPATAPIPPNPADPDGGLGVAEGHTTNYGRFLVSSGPYMFEGSENLDFSVPAKDQEPVSGYVPGRSIVLVRNPSYDPATDGLRPAYPDRIEATIGGDPADLFNKVDDRRGRLRRRCRDAAGERSAGVQHRPRPAAVPAHVPAERRDLHLDEPRACRRSTTSTCGKRSTSRTTRRAAGSWEVAPLTGANAGHIFPDGLLDNKLKDYNPYATTDDHGDLALAQAEMEQSKYDTDGDGVCDDPVCDERHRARRATGSGSEGDGAVHRQREGSRDHHQRRSSSTVR